MSKNFFLKIICVLTITLISYSNLKAEDTIPSFIKGTAMTFNLRLSNEGVKFRSATKLWIAKKVEIIIKDNRNKIIYSTKFDCYLPPREKKEIVFTCPAPKLPGNYSLWYVLRCDNEKIAQLERYAGKFVVGELLPEAQQPIKAKEGSLSVGTKPFVPPVVTVSALTPEPRTPNIESRIPNPEPRTPELQPQTLPEILSPNPQPTTSEFQFPAPEFPKKNVFEQGKTVPSTQIPESSYVIRSGDVVEIFVMEDETLRRQVMVTPDGYISFPVIGSLFVSGLTTSAVSRQITASLKEKRYLINPSVTVSAIESKSRNFSILGEVRKPGVYPLEEGTTILVAISQAEGYTEFADIKNIKVIRKVGGDSKTIKTIKINLMKTMKVEQEDIVIFPKDIIIVPEKFWR